MGSCEGMFELMTDNWIQHKGINIGFAPNLWRLQLFGEKQHETEHLSFHSEILLGLQKPSAVEFPPRAASMQTCLQMRSIEMLIKSAIHNY